MSNEFGNYIPRYAQDSGSPLGVVGDTSLPADMMPLFDIQTEKQAPNIFFKQHVLVGTHLADAANGGENVQITSGEILINKWVSKPEKTTGIDASRGLITRRAQVVIGANIDMLGDATLRRVFEDVEEASENSGLGFSMLQAINNFTPVAVVAEHGLQLRFLGTPGKPLLSFSISRHTVTGLDGRVIKPGTDFFSDLSTTTEGSQNRKGKSAWSVMWEDNLGTHGNFLLSDLLLHIIHDEQPILDLNLAVGLEFQRLGIATEMNKLLRQPLHTLTQDDFYALCRPTLTIVPHPIAY